MLNKFFVKKIANISNNSVELLRKEVYESSEYRFNKTYKEYCIALDKLKSGLETFIDFDEKFYLQANQDVAIAIVNGAFESGYIHFCIHGQREKRPWSSLYTQKHFALPAKLGDNLLEPVFKQSFNTYSSKPLKWEIKDEKSMLIIVPYLHDHLFFAGYTSFYKDCSLLFDRFDHVNVAVVNAGYNPALLTDRYRNVNVLGYNDISSLRAKPGLIFCFDYETFFIAKELIGDLEHTIYYCQDTEAGFHPLGSLHIRADRAVYESKNIVLSTILLHRYFSQKSLLSCDNIYITAPPIEPFPIVREFRKRLFFYFRPEQFNTRNMSQHIMECVERFCAQYSGYELYLMGTVDTCYSINANSNKIVVLSKLEAEKYFEIIGSCDVVIALIYSAHPGVIAFQAAASGIPTITNTFDNRSADELKRISNNIIPYDPIREELFDKLEEALKLPKREPSFDISLYAGNEKRTFVDFVDTVING